MGNLEGFSGEATEVDSSDFYTDQAVQDALTIGEYENEDDGKLILDSFILQCGSFAVFTEVPGEIMHPRIGVTQKKVRADRLMLPTLNAKQSGWTHGAIVIECKAPQKKLGPIICQCLDYLGSCFYLPGCNTAIVPKIAFIWQAHSLGGGLGSITVNHRIGTVIHYRNRDVIDFRMGPKGIFSIDSNGLFTLKNNIVSGSKAGSR